MKEGTACLGLYSFAKAYSDKKKSVLMSAELI